MKRAGSAIISLLLFWFGSLVYAQGADKPATMSLTTSVLSIISTGDREKLEEDHWVSRNTSGGIEDFSYFKEYANGDSLEIGAKADPGNNDYALKADYEKEGVGSLKFAFKDFRKYFDGTGGWQSSFSPSFYELSQDLHLDIGSFKLEGILARVGQPKYTFSYERDFRNGDKSTLGWHRVNFTGGTPYRYIYPSFTEIDETVNKFKFGVEHTIKNVNVSAEQRYENATTSQEGIYREIFTQGTNAHTEIRTRYIDYDYDMYSTILRCDKTWAEKIFTSLGFMYNRYIGGTTEHYTQAGAADIIQRASSTADQNSVVLTPNISLPLGKDLSMDAGLKFEYVKLNAYGSSFGGSSAVGDVKSLREDRIFGENFGFNYKGFKDAVLYLDGDFKQTFRDHHEIEDSSLAEINYSNEFDNELRIGSKWYLLSNLDVMAEFKSERKLRSYDFPYGGLLIRTMNFFTNAPVFKLNYRPLNWLRTSAGYNYEMTTYGIRSSSSDALEMNGYKAHVCSINLTLTPADSLYCTLFYTKKLAATRTRANGDGGSSSIVPIFNGNADIGGMSFSFAPDEKNTITGSYSMSKSDNFSNEAAATCFPLSPSTFSQTITIGVEHQLRKDLAVELKYTHDEYKDKSNNGIDNYDANLIYTALKMKF